MSTLPAFAELADLEARLGRTFEEDSADETRAQAALDDASALIRIEAGVDWDSIEAVDEIYRDAIVAITVAIARRVMENPEGAQSATVGDASISFGEISSDVFLKATERRLILKAAGRSSLGYVDLEIGTPGWSGDTIAVVGQDEPIPFTYAPLRP